MSAELDHIWSEVQTELRAAVDETTYRIWLEPLRPLSAAEGQLLLYAPRRTCDWIADRFGRVLQTCVAAVLGPEYSADLTSDAQTDERGEQRLHPRRRHRGPAPPRAPSAGASPAPTPADRSSPGRGEVLNPKLTFDQFVIGDSNRLAHAAALAVAELPSQAYNPLFLCSPPGLGKTHLLHSIAAYIHAHGGGLSVRYTTGEAFTNEFLAALGAGDIDRFKTRFRRVDVLLVDDVQFLQRKARTEEEFFHTFNALYDIGSQLIVASDRLPRDLEALEDRLRERFEAGLVADIRPPDHTTRLTILRKRVDHDGIPLADPDALEAIANGVEDNVRVLEGALIRVVAYASLSSRPVSCALAQEVLAGLYPHTAGRGQRRAPVSVAEIQAAACELFDLSPTELLSSSRTQRVAWPRQLAMYLTRELTDESLPTIGRLFGGRDHTTVMHACRRTTTRLADDTLAQQSLTRLRERLSRAAPDRGA